MNNGSATFADFAHNYREHGFWPRPVVLGEKRPPMARWELPDPEIDTTSLRSWSQKYGGLGIGLLMGSPFPDGSRLGALDIDDDRFVPLARAVLFTPQCARFGSRGLVFFARVTAAAANRNFMIRTAGGETIKVGELLVDKKFCVIPPTIHPSGAAYRWLGPSLLDVPYTDLPLIED